MGHSYRVVLLLITTVIGLSACQKKDEGTDFTIEGAWQAEKDADAMLLISKDQMQMTKATEISGNYLSGKSAKAGQATQFKIKRQRTKILILGDGVPAQELKIVSLSKEQLVLAHAQNSENKESYRRISLPQFKTQSHRLQVGASFQFVYATVDRKIKFDEKDLSTQAESERSQYSSMFVCTYSKTTHLFQLGLNSIERGKDGKITPVMDPMITVSRSWPFDLSVVEEGVESKRLLGDIRFTRAGVMRNITPAKALQNCQESYVRQGDQVQFEVSCTDADVEAVFESKTSIEKANLKMIGTCSPLVTE